MKTQEYLLQIRKNKGLNRAILTKIQVDKQVKEATFFLTTDRSYTAEELSEVKKITQAFVPDGVNAQVKITKLVPDVGAIQSKILQFLTARSPGMSAFICQQDVQVSLDQSGARFCIDVSAEEKRLLQKADLLDGISVAGVVGFLTTLLAGAIISAVQKSGFSVFGINVYAQQLTTLIGVIVSVFAVFYIRYVIIGKAKKGK